MHKIFFNYVLFTEKTPVGYFILVLYSFQSN